jgi:hypothetical protein
MVEVFSPFNLESGKTYTVSFMAKAEAARSILTLFQRGSDTYTHYWQQTVYITTGAASYGPFTWTANVSDPATRMNFKIGGNNIDVWIDKVVASVPGATTQPTVTLTAVATRTATAIPVVTVTPTVTATRTVTPTVTRTATATSAPAILGNSAEGTVVDNQAAGWYNAYRYQAASVMTVNAMRIRLAAAGTVHLKTAI